MDGPAAHCAAAAQPHRADLQISDYQAERYSNDAGHGVRLIPFTGNGLKFSS